MVRSTPQKPDAEGTTTKASCEETRWQSLGAKRGITEQAAWFGKASVQDSLGCLHNEPYWRDIQRWKVYQPTERAAIKQQQLQAIRFQWERFTLS